MPLNIIHARLANTVLMYFIIMMAWSYWRFVRKQGSDSSFLGAVVISEILILIQGIFGIVLWLNQTRPEGGSMHILYGVVGSIGLPILFSILKDRSNRYEVLVYGAVYLCLAAIAIRSMVTG